MLRPVRAAGGRAAAVERVAPRVLIRVRVVRAFVHVLVSPKILEGTVPARPRAGGLPRERVACVPTPIRVRTSTPSCMLFQVHAVEQIARLLVLLVECDEIALRAVSEVIRRGVGVSLLRELVVRLPERFLPGFGGGEVGKTGVYVEPLQQGEKAQAMLCCIAHLSPPGMGGPLQRGAQVHVVEVRFLQQNIAQCSGERRVV
mmetsp:Transcript_27594/g.69576  ORF Transcript_27594/g.69576 Transcript_27594/m.69576 type:complete len:202 (+) Transcript_27594:2129-2734(+)